MNRLKCLTSNKDDVNMHICFSIKISRTDTHGGDEIMIRYQSL